MNQVLYYKILRDQNVKLRITINSGNGNTSSGKTQKKVNEHTD